MLIQNLVNDLFNIRNKTINKIYLRSSFICPDPTQTLATFSKYPGSGTGPGPPVEAVTQSDGARRMLRSSEKNCELRKTTVVNVVQYRQTEISFFPFSPAIKKPKD